MTAMSEAPMSAREYFLQMTDPTNWHEGAGPEWAEAMSHVHEGVMEFWDELEENHGSPTTLRLQELEHWKEEQLEVERSWDPQAVGKLLGMALGTPIRQNIQPAIEKLLSRLVAMEEEARCAKAAIASAVHAMQMENWHWKSGVSNDMKRKALAGLTALLREQEGGSP